MLNARVPSSLAEAEVTLSGVIQQPDGLTHLSLTSALEISLEVVRLVASTHDKGEVVGVLDAAHLICRPNGALSFGGAGGNPIAPELKRGDAPDRLSDVYALGALIYRLLTGRKVDPSRVVEPPSHFNPAVDTALDELVLEALDEDPSERPYSARELERRMLEIFGELGLEPGSTTEAKKLISSRASKPPPSRKPAPVPVAAPAPVVSVAAEVAAALKAPAPVAAPAAKAAPTRMVEAAERAAANAKRQLIDVDRDEDLEEDDLELEPPQSGLKRFLYDLGWVKGESLEHRKFVPLGCEEDEPVMSDELRRPRNKLSQFMYDLGWLQNIDWDSPKTLMYLKRGAIALGVLMFIVIVWPSHKEPRLNAAQKALIAQSQKAQPDPAPKAKATLVKAPQIQTAKKASGRR